MEQPELELDYSASGVGTEASWKTIDPSGVIERAGYYLTCAAEQLGWYYQGTYTGHTLKRREDHWLLVMRMERKGKKMVCFVAAASPIECIRLFAWQVKGRAIKWSPDLY